jgi:hypothetical protein
VVARDGEQRVALAGDLAIRRGAFVPVHPGDEVAVVTALAEAGIDPGAPWRASREGAAV